MERDDKKYWKLAGLDDVTYKRMMKDIDRMKGWYENFVKEQKELGCSTHNRCGTHYCNRCYFRRFGNCDGTEEYKKK